MGQTPYSPSFLSGDALIALVTESSLLNVSSGDSMSHKYQQLIANHSIHINSNFVASSNLCIIIRHQVSERNLQPAVCQPAGVDSPKISRILLTQWRKKIGNLKLEDERRGQKRKGLAQMTLAIMQ
ncbi:hypothetical protein AVEN_164032-1 [Araneus ventricosus]|uniref:Uncharacterized protein n=1 Tax=Araneus ventricosus TaxID=182803 RepID=A0A4Y2VYY6_ARAVE|nr:hypothetical protein AVEN_164032-1 [Araneus ventricosus]